MMATLYIKQIITIMMIIPSKLHRCFLPSLAPFGQAVSEEKIFLTLANRKQELPLAAIFVGGMG
jgi:hypothetical protein